MTNRKSNSTKKTVSPKQKGLFEQDKSFLSRGIDKLKGVSRYFWDFTGVISIALGLILILSFVEVTSGAFITPLTTFFSLWFGWGRYLIAVILIYVGIRVLRWRKHPPTKLPIGKIVAIEIAFFLSLGLASIIYSGSPSEAEAGLDPGGIIGWGIAEIFRNLVGPTFGFVIILLLLLVSVFSALRLFYRLEKFIDKQMGKYVLQTRKGAVSSNDEKPSVLTEDEVEDEEKPEQPRKTVWLPPEFRKTFDTPTLADEQPNRPVERSPELPPLDLLSRGDTYKPDKRTINMTAGLIEKTLDEFGIPAKVVGFRTGPTVTQFAVEPGYIDKSDDDRQKIRVSQISSLQRDLALALSAERLRIEAPVPGKSYVGIEIPNANSASVQLRPLIESEAFQRVNSPLALTLGRDVSGRPVVADLATMPHLLIAGTTGSGKSVCITALTACLVMNNTPEALKLAMIDPKRVELMRFNGLPHLMGNVETEIERILGVLRWATTEMDYRYKLLEKARARNIDSYNHKMERQNKAKLPKIVILIDELADLMISAPDQTEHAVIRLAQKARAIGIHLILATQRPSTDVVTGLIKANFPTRISFTVASSIDSRVILDTSGAETLLGKGDMLFLHPEIGLPMRAQGAIVSDNELNKIIRWWKKQEKSVEKIEEKVPQARYDDTEAPPWEEKIGKEDENDEDELLIKEAIALIKAEGHASASYFQRQLRVGYPRAARLVDQLEEMGVIGSSQGGGREREILIDTDDEENGR
ncbi:MAG: DNA translocase FtsK 4TM domain-containing protein [Brevefilum sp.]|nr:DNA translocase FtsK 4TM domain-containing protein [Brevefilum sp.]MDT8381164.1 DNA translocase FtsK 4TM domain-containing protein [Brevefilum sp.]